MRNLKAWDPSAKRMNEIRGYVDNKDTTKIFYAGMGGYVSYPKDKIVIIEGIGLKDKNGNEYFKGDILKTKNGSIGYIVWSVCAWVIESPGSLAQDLEYESFYNQSEIIGNVYENPEHLK